MESQGGEPLSVLSNSLSVWGLQNWAFANSKKIKYFFLAVWVNPPKEYFYLD